MSAPLRLLGDERALGLAGLPGAEPASVGAGPPSAGAGPATVLLGEPAAGAEPADVVWLPGPAGAAHPSGARVIATSGDGLWSRAPWPARDDLFDLAPAAEPCALVAGGDEERRAIAVRKLEARGRPVVAAPDLSAELLARASVVALLGDADDASPTRPWAAQAMPADAPAVLAARRILVAPRCRIAFGLMAGGGHLAFGAEDDVVAYVDTALSFPRALDPLVALGALTAERHRASVVHARLGAELAAA
jgi:hypothetical protein